MFIEPTCYSKATHHSHWHEAMAFELHALEENSTWTLDPLPLADHSLFTLITATNLTIGLIYVDDILVVGNDLSQVSYFKSVINSTHFKTKDHGPLKYFLGLEVARSPSGIFLNQQKYALDIVADSGQLGSHLAAFPMKQKLKLNDTDGELLPDLGPY
ncbi:uncharacterized mitochondrial protein AtMg00810-like [Carya illinoinensis]|uniref:uncharacterized mitochondrial protein AtMg00810-like n=1 Tax=Carya illinoinensis TaxID=32201 RepID=UPI001C7256D1|nr:uncharacterized mitochondrial protein AtMg00810-like [Carya illinoinensis]